MSSWSSSGRDIVRIGASISGSSSSFSPSSSSFKLWLDRLKIGGPIYRGLNFEGDGSRLADIILTASLLLWLVKLGSITPSFRLNALNLRFASGLVLSGSRTDFFRSPIPSF